MAVRLILPVKLMNSLDHLVRYMKRSEGKTLENTNENMPAVTQEGGGDAVADSKDSAKKGKKKALLWKKVSQLATTSVVSEDGTRITSTLDEIRTFLNTISRRDRCHRAQKDC